MAGSQIPTSVTIIASLKGYQAISLNNYSTSAAASIAAGSVVEIAGAFFTFVADETPDASTWTSLATGATGYIALTPSGTAGSQIVSVTYTATAPTWRDDFQGWYASAASTTRVIGTVYKTDTPSYNNKKLFDFQQDSSDTSGYKVYTSSGYFFVPPNVSTVYITGTAAGGNGGNGNTTLSGGGGGGGGEIILTKGFSVTPLATIPITIGEPGSNTMFGAVSFNCGSSGGNAVGAVGGAGGSGGILINGSVAGANGGKGLGTTAAVIGGATDFAGGGGISPLGVSGGGGGGGFGFHVGYISPTAGGTSSTTGGVIGTFGGGGGGGSYNTAGTGASGGRGGYGSGGGGGGGGSSGSGTPGSGGSAILIVSW